MENNEQQSRRPNRFVCVLKAIFVHNIGWKLLAIVSAGLIWMLAAGLW